MMETAGDKEGYCRRRGRPRMNRSFKRDASPRCYAPQCNPNEKEEVVLLLPEEIAVLDLIDLQDMEQEQAAAVLRVSRKTIWRDIHEAHRKIADALIHGKSLEIGGCLRRQSGICPRRNAGACIKANGSDSNTWPDSPVD
ncbi:MAG: DUF134 domain-containing protein [Methanoregula sp.]|nr:MAG: DUF134 domain-containing protein [Methanoregula sp.]